MAYAYLQFSMEEEGGVVFPVVSDNSNEIVYGWSTPSRVHNTVENVAQSEGRSHGRENVHDMLQRWSFAVPHDPDRHYFRSVHQGSTDLDFGSTGTLEEPENRFEFNDSLFKAFVELFASKGYFVTNFFLNL